MTLKLRMCCDEMEDYYNHGTVMIYDRIRVGIFTDGRRVIDLDYCPWCGRKIFMDRMWEDNEGNNY